MLVNRFIILIFVYSSGVVLAQGQSFQFGTAPTEAEIKAVDTLVDMEGRLLPDGKGTVAEGANIYAMRCAMCHGPNGEGTKSAAGTGPVLVAKERGGVRNYHHATTLFSYIYRAMPMHQERTLSVDQAYALTAYLLHRSGIIRENQQMNAKTLPQVKMPRHSEWKSPPEMSG